MLWPTYLYNNFTTGNNVGQIAESRACRTRSALVGARRA